MSLNALKPPKKILPKISKKAGKPKKLDYLNLEHFGPKPDQEISEPPLGIIGQDEVRIVFQVGMDHPGAFFKIC